MNPTREYQLLGVRLDGAGPFLRETVGGAQTAATKLSRARGGDFIYSRLFAWRGAFGVVPPELDGCYVSEEFPTFQPIPGRLDLDFLRLWFRLPETLARVGQDCSGSTPLTRNRYKEEFFLALEVALPPLPEQRRLVARIEELAARIEQARKLRGEAQEEAGQLYLSHLAQIVQPRSGSWRLETVADVILGMDAGWSPQCEDIPARQGEWGVLKTTAVQWCEFRSNENKALPATLRPLPALAVQEGDVLVTRAGPKKRVGVVAAVRRSEGHLTISDKIIRLRPDPRRIHYRFLELSLASPLSQEHLVRRKTGLADAQVNISQTILAATPVAYPGLEQQIELVAQVDAVQERVDILKRAQADTAAELDALLPSILDRAFKGEL